MYERDFRTNKKDKLQKFWDELDRVRMSAVCQANQKKAKLFVKTWKDKKSQGKKRLSDAIDSMFVGSVL